MLCSGLHKNIPDHFFFTLKYFRCFCGKCKIGVESDKLRPFYMRKGNEKIIIYSAMSDINLCEKPKKDNGLCWVLRVTFGMLMSNTDYNMVSTLIPGMRLWMKEYMYDFFFNLYTHALIFACLCINIRTHELRSNYHACVLSHTRIILWLHLKVKLKLRSCDLAVRDLGTHLCLIGPEPMVGTHPPPRSRGQCDTAHRSSSSAGFPRYHLSTTPNGKRNRWVNCASNAQVGFKQRTLNLWQEMLTTASWRRRRKPDFICSFVITNIMPPRTPKCHSHSVYPANRNTRVRNLTPHE